MTGGIPNGIGGLREWMNVSRDQDGFEYCCPTALEEGLTYETLKALLAVAEAASDPLNHGLDHPSGQIKMADGSVQPCPLCIALDRLRAAA